MTKYRVSLACKVPVNYEWIEVEANNEVEAQKLAITQFEDHFDSQMIAEEPVWEELTLDIGNKEPNTGTHWGVAIEEL